MRGVNMSWLGAHQLRHGFARVLSSGCDYAGRILKGEKAANLPVVLISYSANIEERFYRAATFIDKILKGAKPSELPIEQPTRFELIVNAKTAKAQGIEIPSLILAQAHEVIE